MPTVSLKLLTIVCDPALEVQLIHDLRELGARGERIIEARGEGDWELQRGPGTRRYLKVETIVDPDVAEAILKHVADAYFPKTSMMAYVLDACVIRVDKFEQRFNRKHA